MPSEETRKRPGKEWILKTYGDGSFRVTGPADERTPIVVVPKRDQARVEQDLENEQVRQIQRTGRCPCCGADAH